LKYCWDRWWGTCITYGTPLTHHYAQTADTISTAEQCAIPPLNPEAKVYRNDVEKAWQREERFSLEPVKLGQEGEILKEE
jgi:hypothetical protein